MEEKVSLYMRRGAFTCTEDTTVREVAQIMVVNRIGYCVVLDQKHEVVGIISLRSILKGFGSDLDKTKAKDILISHTITVTPDTPLADAIAIMAKNRIEHLIVVSNRPNSKVILGLLRAMDIVRMMARGREIKR